MGVKTINYYQRLRDIREDHDQSQEEIAALLNTTRQQYARWESGNWQMPIEHYKTLAKFYDCSIDYLAGLCNQPTAPGGGPYKVTRIGKIVNHGNINFKQ